MKEIFVSTVDLNEKVVVDRDGLHYGITDMIDDTGEFTHESSEAVCVIGVMPDGRWFNINLRAMERVTVQ